MPTLHPSAGVGRRVDAVHPSKGEDLHLSATFNPRDRVDLTTALALLFTVCRDRGQELDADRIEAKRRRVAKL
jgi:hypothetical protein